MAGRCLGCGRNVPRMATFCPHCGARVARSWMPTKSMSMALRLALAAGASGLVVVVVLYALVFLGPGLSSRVSGIDPVAARPVVTTQSQGLLMSDEHLVEPGRAKYWTFQVQPDMKNPRLAVKFEATGGAGNDIRVMVLNPHQFLQWRSNAVKFRTLYDSGYAHASTVEVTLREPGTYHLVLDNTFSTDSGKNVVGS